MINSSIIINTEATLLDALKKMDEVDRKLLIVCEDKCFIGVVSIGDIQRALLRKTELSEKLKNVLRKEITVASVGDNIMDIKALMKKDRIECMPVINQNGMLVDTIEWNEVCEDTYSRSLNKQYPVVIMAGGKGTRLLPLTNLIPKPLIPISNKTIIEEIMGKFAEVGCKEFYISVNYMADSIREFFRKKDLPETEVNFIQETMPLGTAGSLYLLKDTLKSTFFVSNCDIIAQVDFAEMMRYHKENGNMITVLSVLKDYSIPYGTLETMENGLLVELREKPQMVYQINSGIYILEPTVFDYINDGEYIHITGLMERLLANHQKVGVFPISDGSWFDMGNWEEYNKVIKKYNSLA